MKNQIVLFFRATLITMIICTSLKAQQGIVPVGGTINGSSGSASYSVGQLFYKMNFGKNGLVSEGLQQGYEISVLTGVELETISLEIIAFPNPTTNYLNLKTSQINNTELAYVLYSMDGVRLASGRLESDSTIIEMINLPESIYILKITEGNFVIKTFKIVKK